MRQILENSKVPFITLQEEISSLETYIELEKMRFENKFQSTISIADDIESEHTLVPPLLLQPYVENAIWHGLMHKDSPGLLKISILLKQGNLVMQIEDNGIGRKAAALLKSKPQNHNSTALKATEERLLLIERTTGKKVAVEIIDLENEKGEPFGTKVVLTMPLLED
jgi:LytS/YehU family sensor histidine kinase